MSGAAAILEYNTVASPLAQPRNLIFSHAFCSVIAVGITKLFALLPHDRFEDLRWLAGAIIVATCSVVMSITKTVHPPAGAMALLAATSPQISNLGWNLVPLVMIGAALMLGNALAINNIQRQFPLFWMTPVDPHEARRKLRGSAAHLEDSYDWGRKAEVVIVGHHSGPALPTYSMKGDAEPEMNLQTCDKLVI
ncbi:MAG: hypothetical protein Q9159_003635 [Coniocarpon cinnabarinum]